MCLYEDGPRREFDVLPIHPLGPAPTALIFSTAAFLLYCGTKAIPSMASFSGTEPVLMWFVAVSVFLFIPLLGARLVDGLA